ncbi:MAG TPA: arginine--tRNA ligase, partial [Candidatus Bathyarchaeia archaeon]|nr:arginine--tRNA ligase [Candidatus Bathyarchaeia archaeon]
MVDSKHSIGQSNPFGQFRTECEKILQAALASLKRAGKNIPEVEIASTLEDPPNHEFGHLASSLSFELAREQQTKPMLIAREIADEAKKLEPFELTESINAAEPGYVNFKARLSSLAQLTLESIHREGDHYGKLTISNPQRVIVEHTSANPARPIHIGTAKNAIFGDTLARILSARGHKVQAHFYIDDTGRQVAQMAYGYRLLGEPEPQGKTDEYFGKIYSITSTLAEVDENKKRLAILKKTNASDIDIIAVTKDLDEWV